MGNSVLLGPRAPPPDRWVPIMASLMVPPLLHSMPSISMPVMHDSEYNGLSPWCQKFIKFPKKNTGISNSPRADSVTSSTYLAVLRMSWCCGYSMSQPSHWQWQQQELRHHPPTDRHPSSHHSWCHLHHTHCQQSPCPSLMTLSTTFNTPWLQKFI